MSEEQVSQNHTEDTSAQVDTEATEDAVKDNQTTTEPFYKDETKVESKPEQDAPEADDDAETESDDTSDESEGYKLKAPEDSKLTDADLNKIALFAKEQGLSQEAAEKLVSEQAELKESYWQELQEEHERNTEQWVEQVRSDKELGGQNFETSVGFAKKAAERFGTETFIDMLNESGFGNHPEVIRVFSRIGRAMADDNLVKGGVHSGGSQSMEDLFYSNNKD